VIRNSPSALRSQGWVLLALGLVFISGAAPGFGRAVPTACTGHVEAFAEPAATSHDCLHEPAADLCHEEGAGASESVTRPIEPRTGRPRTSAGLPTASTPGCSFRAAAEDAGGITARSYVDVTKGTSVRNVVTDAAHTEFADTLKGNGWVSRGSKDGTVQIFDKDGAK
jgi:hypothetical protein